MRKMVVLDKCHDLEWQKMVGNSREDRLSAISQVNHSRMASRSVRA